MSNTSPGRNLPYAAELLLAALAGGILVFLFRGERAEIPQGTASSPMEDVSSKPNVAATAEAAAPQPTTVDTTLRERPTQPGAAESFTLVYGTVKSAQGTPGRGLVTFDGDSMDAELLGWINEQGEYAIAGAPAGSSILIAKIEKCSAQTRRIDIPPLTERLRCDFTLQPSLCIPVQIMTTDGVRLFGAPSARKLDWRLTQNVNIVVTPTRPGLTFVGVGKYLSRDGLGDFQRREYSPLLKKEHPEDVEGVLELLRPPPLFASLVMGRTVIQTLPVTADLDKLVFTVDVTELQNRKGSIRVSVVKPSGESSTTASVSLLTPFSARGGVRDEKGVLFADVSPDSYTVQVTDGNSVQHLQAVDLEPGQHLDLGPLTLGKTIAVKGKTVIEKGRAIRTDLGSREWKGAELGPRHEREWLSSGDGTFELDLTPGRHLLDASAPGHAATALTIDTATLTDAPVILTLRRGTPVILTLPEARPGTVRYSIRDSAEQIVWTRSARVDIFRLRLRLTDGLYTLIAESSTGSKAQQEFQVESKPLVVKVEVP